MQVEADASRSSFPDLVTTDFDHSPTSEMSDNWSSVGENQSLRITGFHFSIALRVSNNFRRPQGAGNLCQEICGLRDIGFLIHPVHWSWLAIPNPESP